MTAPIRLILIDDHPIFRAGLKQILSADPAFAVDWEAADGASGLELIRRHHPAVAVLDFSLPKLSGMDVARAVRAKKLPTHLVMLTMHNDEATVNCAVDVGILGFVLKDDAATCVAECVRTVAEGNPYLSPSVSAHLVRQRGRTVALSDGQPGLAQLTKAERRILALVSEKKTSRAIAAELFVSVRTVDAHRANIAAKLGLHGSHSLLHFALEHRLAL